MIKVCDLCGSYSTKVTDDPIEAATGGLTIADLRDIQEWDYEYHLTQRHGFDASVR